MLVECVKQIEQYSAICGHADQPDLEAQIAQHYGSTFRVGAYVDQVLGLEHPDTVAVLDSLGRLRLEQISVIDCHPISRKWQ